MLTLRSLSDRQVSAKAPGRSSIWMVNSLVLGMVEKTLLGVFTVTRGASSAGRMAGRSDFLRNSFDVASRTAEPCLECGYEGVPTDSHRTRRPRALLVNDGRAAR